MNDGNGNDEKNIILEQEGTSTSGNSTTNITTTKDAGSANNVYVNEDEYQRGLSLSSSS